MASNAMPPSTTSFPPNDGFDTEPDEQWKAELKQSIEERLLSMVKDAKRSLEQQLLQPGILEVDRDRYKAEHTQAMKSICNLATVLYQAELDDEKIVRTGGANLPPRLNQAPLPATNPTRSPTLPLPTFWKPDITPEEDAAASRAHIAPASRVSTGRKQFGRSAAPRPSSAETIPERIESTPNIPHKSGWGASPEMEARYDKVQEREERTSHLEYPYWSGSTSERNTAHRHPAAASPVFWKPSITPEEDAAALRPSTAPSRWSRTTSTQSSGSAGRRPSNTETTPDLTKSTIFPILRKPSSTPEEERITRQDKVQESVEQADCLEDPPWFGWASEGGATRSPPTVLPIFWKPSVVPGGNATASNPSIALGHPGMQFSESAARRPSVAIEAIPVHTPRVSNGSGWGLMEGGVARREVLQEREKRTTPLECASGWGPRLEIYSTSPLEYPAGWSQVPMLRRLNPVRSPSIPLPALWKPSITPEEDAALSKLYAIPARWNGSPGKRLVAGEKIPECFETTSDISSTLSQDRERRQATNKPRIAHDTVVQEREEKLGDIQDALKAYEAIPHVKGPIKNLKKRHSSIDRSLSKDAEGNGQGAKVPSVGLQENLQETSLTRGLKSPSKPMKASFATAPSDSHKSTADAIIYVDSVTAGFDRNDGEEDESDDENLAHSPNGESLNVTNVCRLQLDQVGRNEAFLKEIRWSRTEVFRDACNILFNIVLPNRDKYQKLLHLEQHNAQIMLDFMQVILDHFIMNSVDSKLEKSLLKAMLRLSKQSELYPSSYVLTGIKRSEYPKISGHYGEIFEGDLNGRKLSLKVFKLYSSQMSKINDLLKAFYKEAIIWRHLVHLNLLPFYGIYKLGDSGGRICLVSPWMTNGNISEYLKQHPDTNRSHLVSDVAHGLAYLHEKSIVHDDLKGVNVLINDNGMACLADFGLSSIFIDTPSLAWTSIDSTVSNTGTVRWQAPELLGAQNIGTTKESDIYAFACVCYEVFTGNIPFYEIRNDMAMVIHVTSGHRPPRPKINSPSYICWGLTEWVWSLIEECWNQESTSRPKVSEVIMRLASREEFSRTGHKGQESWGDLRPELFRSLVGKNSLVFDADIQLSLSVLNSL